MARCKKWPRCQHDKILLCPYCMHPVRGEGLESACCGECGHAEWYCTENGDDPIDDNTMPWQSSTRMDRVWDRIDRVWDSSCILGITIAMLYLLGIV